jgi:hypothetical protein
VNEHNKRIEVPDIPPKLMFGNMKEENITKRMLGLQTFLDGLAKYEEFLSDEEVIQFFNLNTVCNR